MKKCFGCLRKIRFMFHRKTQNQKWLYYLQSYCSTHHKNQWCDILNQHYDQISKYQHCSQQTMRQLRSTNISSEIIKTIRKQYQANKSPLGLIIQIFATYIQRRYSQTINPTQITINKILHDYQNFLDFMRSLTVIYYKLEQRELIGDDQFFRVTLSNFLIDCLFNCLDFQTCVANIVRQSCKQSHDRVSFNMQKYESLKIEQYGVASQFCLNQKTLEKFNLQNQELKNKPYNGAIHLVRQVVKCQNPLQKLKCFENIISQIQFNIKKFYEDRNIKKSQISLDADNAIAILLYIIVQSNQSQLPSHLSLVQNFVEKQSMGGTSTYCLATYKVCLQFLEKGNIKRCKGFMIPENQFSLWINVRSYFEHHSST